MSEQMIISGGSNRPQLMMVIEEARQSGKKIILDPRTEEMLDEIKRHEQRRDGLGALAMMAQMFGSVYSIGDKPHSTPHYFEYSGIPSEEQKRKRAERKARKKAIKGGLTRC